MIYWLTHFLVRNILPLFFPFRFLGQDNIPPSGSFIFASNHISNLDPVLIGICTNRRISFMAKDSLFKNPLFGFYLKCLETYPVKREASDVKAIRETLRRIKSGFPVVIFPQGTRKSKDVHEGVGLIVQKSQVPVVPVCVVGSDQVLPQGSKFFKRRLVKVFIGKPISFVQSDTYLQTAQRIMTEIYALPEKFPAP